MLLSLTQTQQNEKAAKKKNKFHPAIRPLSSAPPRPYIPTYLYLKSNPRSPDHGAFFPRIPDCLLLFAGGGVIVLGDRGLGGYGWVFGGGGGGKVV